MAAPVNTSSDLLAVTGDGSTKSVVENLLKQPDRRPPQDKPRTFKVARSPLLDQLQTFLPEFQRSTEQLLSQPPQQLHHLSVENTDDDARVVEMNLLLGQGAPKDRGDDGQGIHNSGEETSDSDSDDDLLQTRRVTAENLQLPGEVQGKRQQSLIQVVSESCEREEELSDGEVTVASSASGER
ncbi:NOP protein chaperone 1-like [Eriocheir sinensis]|uniref:NOP protein chaperone 1-like n=1 Tax=Eriocheir sinensis TaxID=95602 RepID=UPI0021C829D6|nr:NOP protein chaperone 1-like [Eriocheir sinensis]